MCSLQRPWLQSAASLAPGRVTSSRLSYFVRSSLHLTEFLKLSQYACFSKRRWVLLEAATKETLTLKIEPNVFQLQSDWPPTGYFFSLSQPQKWQESTSVIWPSGGHCLSLGEIIQFKNPLVQQWAHTWSNEPPECLPCMSSSFLSFHAWCLLSSQHAVLFLHKHFFF